MKNMVNSSNKQFSKRRIALTGATGTMGMEMLRQLSDRLDHFTVRLLARSSKKNSKLLAPWIGKEGIEIVWGDLMNPDDVCRLVKGADFVLHLGGMVSPAADYYPEKTFKVNTGGMRNVVDAVRKEPNPNKVGIVYIGSVAQYGSYMPPHHWGRCGDLLQPPPSDGYAVSKTAAERILSDSGLKKWVSLRMSGILHKGLIDKATDPITFHGPIKGVLEWVNLEDAGRLIHVGEEWGPDSFWCNFYNVGGGDTYRLTNYEFESMIMKALHCPPPEKVFDVRWFATQNFHGMWYADSDKLNDILHFRGGITAANYFNRIADSVPWYFSLTPLVPALVMKTFMHWVAGRNSLAPLYWRKHNIKDRIETHFGSLEAWNALPGWECTDLSRPSDTPHLMPVGYDDAKPTEEFDIEDMRKVAEWRGGKCLSDNMTRGDLTTPLKWATALGETFTASPASVVLGGHWGREVVLTSK